MNEIVRIPKAFPLYSELKWLAEALDTKHPQERWHNMFYNSANDWLMAASPSQYRVLYNYNAYQCPLSDAYWYQAIITDKEILLSPTDEITFSNNPKYIIEIANQLRDRMQILFSLLELSPDSADRHIDWVSSYAKITRGLPANRALDPLKIKGMICDQYTIGLSEQNTVIFESVGSRLAAIALIDTKEGISEPC